MFEDYEDASATTPETRNQMNVTGAAGVRALWTPSIGDQILVVRIDARFAPYTVDAGRLSMWHHGLSLGWSPSPRR